MSEDTKKAPEQKFGDQVQEVSNKFINSNYTTKGQELIEQGFAVYLLSQGTNTPHKGSNGHLDATKDVNVLANMFDKYRVDSNIGIVLQGTNLVCLDIDRHTPDKNGLNTLKQLGITANFDDEVFETTPRDGIHLFYRVTEDLDVSSLKRNIGAGLELVTDKITVAPSVKGGVAYKHFGKSFNEASMMPKWLIDLASNVPTSEHATQKRQPKYSIQERWEMVLNGFIENERNNMCVSLSGYLLRINVDPNIAFEIVKLINSRSVTPLPDKELFTTFKSAYEREKQRREKGSK